MQAKPIIGIFGQIQRPNNPDSPGHPRLDINADYPWAIAASGGIPLVLCPYEDLAVLERQVSLCDGLFFTGGNDVDPALYGEDPEQDFGSVDHLRDCFEQKGFHLAMEHKIPSFGVCRGMQMMNVTFKGSLYQHLSKDITKQKHVQDSRPNEATHSINLEADSYLAQVTGQTQIKVNSFHHQAIKKVAPDFKVLAKANDGIVEAIQYQGDFFMAGVQWHPELMYTSCEEARKILTYFVEQCRR